MFPAQTSQPPELGFERRSCRRTWRRRAAGIRIWGKTWRVLSLCRWRAVWAAPRIRLHGSTCCHSLCRESVAPASSSALNRSGNRSAILQDRSIWARCRGAVAAAAGQFLVVAPLSGDNSPFSRLKVEKRRPTTCRMEKRRPTTRRVEVKCAAAISASGAERWMPLPHFVFATRSGSCIRIPWCLPYNMTIRIIHRGRRATRPPDAVGEEPAWRRSATCSMTSSISPRA